MGLDHFEQSKQKLLNSYGVDVFKDILFGRKGRVFLYTDIEQKDHVELHVISNRLTVLGLDDTESISLDQLLSYLDADNKYAEVAGKREYVEFVKKEMVAFDKEIDITFPIKIRNHRHWIHFSGFSIEKTPRIYIFVAHEHSELMDNEEQVFEKTHKDSLTGLFNRYTFDYHYGLRYHLENLHVIYLDIDNFKIINDRYGHQTGNAALQAFASVLKLFQNEYSMFYRLGGDEFVGLIFDSEDHILKMADQILSETRKIVIAFDHAHLTTSIGVIQATKRENLVRKADDLLYMAKKQGKDQFIFDVER